MLAALLHLARLVGRAHSVRAAGGHPGHRGQPAGAGFRFSVFGFQQQLEQDALAALIPTSITSLPLTGGVWIGLSDILREGTFDTWRDDSPVKLNNNGLSKTW